MTIIQDLINGEELEFDPYTHKTIIHISELEGLMKTYAEIYAPQVLKLAAENAIMSSNLREDSNLANIWINRESIINTKLPEHI